MVRISTVLSGSILWLSASIAHAQPAPAPAPGPAPTAQPAPTPPTTARPAQPPPPPPQQSLPRNDAAWSQYHTAFQQLTAGKATAASKSLADLVRTYPGHPAAALAKALLQALAPDAPTKPVPSKPSKPRIEAPTRSARAELAVVQLFHGMAAGVEFCILMSCEEGGAVVGLTLLGGGVAVVASLGGTGENGILPGRRGLLNSGIGWGLYNAAVLVSISDVDSNEAAGTLLVGQGLGLLLGGSMWNVRPTAGQVAIANTVGMWTGVISLLSLSAGLQASGDSSLTDRHVGLLLAASDLGLVAGAALAARFPSVTRTQSMLMDAGGVVGVLGGIGTGVLITNEFDNELTLALGAVGGVVGLGSAAYLAKRFRTSDTNATIGLIPTKGGVLATLGGKL